jgi:hypothetical protein
MVGDRDHVQQCVDRSVVTTVQTMARSSINDTEIGARARTAHGRRWSEWRILPGLAEDHRRTQHQQPALPARRHQPG